MKFAAHLRSSRPKIDTLYFLQIVEAAYGFPEEAARCLVVRGVGGDRLHEPEQRLSFLLSRQAI